MYMYINVETCDGGNKHFPSYPTKEVQYHHNDEITVINR